MRWILVALGMMFLASGCVNLDKPARVAECAGKGTCTNSVRIAPTEQETPLDGAVAEDSGPGARVDAGEWTPLGDGPTANQDVPATSTDALADTVDARPDEQSIPPITSDARDGVVGSCVSGGMVLPAGTVCRASTDSNRCDPAETCTGLSAICPADITYGQPAVPGNVSTTAGTLQAAIVWNAAFGATGYNVKRSTTNGSGYTTLATSPTTSGTSYADQGLTGGSTYYYVVSSVNTISTCESANSLQVSATPAGSCTPPAAPAITATPGDHTVTLNWAPVTGAASYSVGRSLNSGSGYETLGTVTNGTMYADSSVVNATRYYYVVTASNGTCSSSNSNEASTVLVCMPLAAPTGLTATTGLGSVSLSWTASIGASSYSIYRNTDGSSTYSLLTSTTQTKSTDSSVSAGSTYYYVVTAGNGSCSSGYSAQVSAAPACVPPAVPTAVTPTAGDSQITLAWSAPLGATLYRISRNTTGTGTFTQVGTNTAANYLDSALANGTRYYYVVAASNGSCWSGNSGVVSAAPTGAPHIVYDDALANGWANWSWGGTYAFNDATPVESGTASIALLYTGGFAGLQFHNDAPVSTAGRSAFTFWAHGGATGTRRVRFWVKNATDAGSPNIILNIPSGIWTKFTVSLTNLGNPATVKEVLIQDDTGGAQPVFNVDQVELD